LSKRANLDFFNSLSANVDNIGLQLWSSITVTIRNYLKLGKLKGQKVMGRWFILDDDIVEFFRELQ
jgi:hypothetical protein